MTTHTLGEIAARFGLELRGDARDAIRGVATLADAGAGQLGFLANPRYRAQLAATRADAIVLRADDADAFARASLIAPDPYVAFAHIATLFERAPAAAPGVHASAVVGKRARHRSRRRASARTASSTPKPTIGEGAIARPALRHRPRLQRRRAVAARRARDAGAAT